MTLDLEQKSSEALISCGFHFGVAAMVLGSFAIVFVIVAQHAESFRGITSAYLLNWLDARGLVHTPQPASVVEFVNPGLFVVTDKGAIRWLLVNSMWFAVWSILLALWAEFKLEHTLYLSSGLILGVLALELFSFQLGLLAMGIVAVTVIALRGRRRA
jgi:hypothetical protein